MQHVSAMPENIIEEGVKSLVKKDHWNSGPARKCLQKIAQ